MSGNEYVKYMTDTLVKRWEMPKAERKLIKGRDERCKTVCLIPMVWSASILHRDAIQKVHEVLARNLWRSCPAMYTGQERFLTSICDMLLLLLY